MVVDFAYNFALCDQGVEVQCIRDVNKCRENRCGPRDSKRKLRTACINLEASFVREDSLAPHIKEYFTVKELESLPTPLPCPLKNLSPSLTSSGDGNELRNDSQKGIQVLKQIADSNNDVKGFSKDPTEQASSPVLARQSLSRQNWALPPCFFGERSDASPANSVDSESLASPGITQKQHEPASSKRNREADREGSILELCSRKRSHHPEGQVPSGPMAVTDMALARARAMLDAAPIHLNRPSVSVVAQVNSGHFQNCENDMRVIEEARALLHHSRLHNRMVESVPVESSTRHDHSMHEQTGLGFCSDNDDIVRGRSRKEPVLSLMNIGRNHETVAEQPSVLISGMMVGIGPNFQKQHQGSDQSWRDTEAGTALPCSDQSNSPVNAEVGHINCHGGQPDVFRPVSLFRMASGKPVFFSPESLEQARKFVEELEAPPVRHCLQESHSSLQIHSPGSKIQGHSRNQQRAGSEGSPQVLKPAPVHVPSEQQQIEHLRATLTERLPEAASDGNIGAVFKQNRCNSLFQTGLGRPLSISVKAMERAQALLSLESLNPPSQQDRVESQPEPERVISKGEQSDLKMLDMDVPGRGSSPCVDQTSFQTPCAKVRTREKEDYHMLDAQTINKTKGCPFPLPQSPSVVSSAGFDQAFSPMHKLEKQSKHKVIQGSLFQTASGRNVRMSSAGLKQAESLLEGEYVWPKSPKTTGKSLFQTATGRPVSFSSSAMERARCILGEDAEVCYSDQDSFGSIRPAGTSIRRPLQQLSENLQPASRPAGNRKRLTTGHSHHASKTSSGVSLHAARKAIPWSSTPKSTLTMVAPGPRIQGLLPIPMQDLMRNPFPKQMHSLFNQGKRLSLDEFFGHQPGFNQQTLQLPEEVQQMTSKSAVSFTVENMGPSGFRRLLLAAGGSSELATEEWVTNHYRWIVWKLASLERSFAHKVGNKLLTKERILDQLKYRYEREINRSSRSALHKIAEKDAAAGRAMVLCISTIIDVGCEFSRRHVDEDGLRSQLEASRDEDGAVDIADQRGGGHMKDDFRTRLAMIEVTDGWYWMRARLDSQLSRLLRKGKLSVGHKIRVSRAVLLGCDDGLPPLEACKFCCLILHINGTTPAYWSDRLGFCSTPPRALALKCVRSDGGLVPLTCLAVVRIYPMLFRERLPGGGGLVRSARAEDVAARNYEEKRSKVAEAATYALECASYASKGPLMQKYSEGAALLASLEAASDPEGAVAHLTHAQHSALATYQAQEQDARQADIEKAINKALKDGNLSTRNVTPVLRIRVVGLQRVCPDTEASPGEDGKGETPGHEEQQGVVTVWGPSDEQVQHLVEEGVYLVSNLQPSSVKPPGEAARGQVCHLSSTRSTTWTQLSDSQVAASFFRHSFPRRTCASLSDLLSFPVGMEFDFVGLVLSVGDPQLHDLKTMQWLFLCDGTAGPLGANMADEPSRALLAVKHSVFTEGFVPLPSSLQGSVVAWSNLVLQPADSENQLLTAEASEVALLSSVTSLGERQVMRRAAAKVSQWAAQHPQETKSLQQKLLTIVSQGPAGKPTPASPPTQGLRDKASVGHETAPPKGTLTRCTGGSVCNPDMTHSPVMVPESSTPSPRPPLKRRFSFSNT